MVVAPLMRLASPACSVKDFLPLGGGGALLLDPCGPLLEPRNGGSLHWHLAKEGQGPLLASSLLTWWPNLRE